MAENDGGAIEGIADALMTEIDRRGINQVAAATLLGTTQQTLSKWLNGVHQPGPDRIGALADFLSRSPDEIEELLPHHQRARRQSNVPRLNAIEERLDRIALRQASLGERLERLADRLEAMESRGR